MVKMVRSSYESVGVLTFAWLPTLLTANEEFSPGPFERTLLDSKDNPSLTRLMVRSWPAKVPSGNKRVATTVACGKHIRGRM